ncbi:MAG: hypothetical protein C4327_10710 [Meiothermus sp.]
MGHPGANKPGGQREIVKAILYALENSIQWRAMPHDLPHGSVVYPSPSGKRGLAPGQRPPGTAGGRATAPAAPHARAVSRRAGRPPDPGSAGQRTPAQSGGFGETGGPAVCLPPAASRTHPQGLEV